MPTATNKPNDDDDDRTLTAEERATLQNWIEAATVAEIAKRLGVSPNTLRALAGGCRGQRGTVHLIRAGLKYDKALAGLDTTRR